MSVVSGVELEDEFKDVGDDVTAQFAPGEQLRNVTEYSNSEHVAGDFSVAPKKTPVVDDEDEDEEDSVVDEDEDDLEDEDEDDEALEDDDDDLEDDEDEDDELEDDDEDELEEDEEDDEDEDEEEDPVVAQVLKKKK